MAYLIFREEVAKSIAYIRTALFRFTELIPIQKKLDSNISGFSRNPILPAYSARCSKWPLLCS